MTFPKRLFFTVGGVIGASLLGAFIIRRGDNAALWVPLGLSVASLVVAILAAFKNELFEFAPAVLGSEVFLAQAQPAHDKLTVIIPLSFINTGYAEGVIEWVAIKLTYITDGQFSILEPVVEVDLIKFLQGKRYLHAESTLGQFASFPLESKKVVSKAILFAASPDKPSFTLVEGKYRFDVYVKSSSVDKAELLHSFNQEFTKDLLTKYLAGSSIMLSSLIIDV
jgi:hypothetical protein